MAPREPSRVVGSPLTDKSKSEVHADEWRETGTRMRVKDDVKYAFIKKGAPDYQ